MAGPPLKTRSVQTKRGNDAFGRLLEHGAGLGGVLLRVGVLLAFAAALLVAATWRLRRVLTRSSER